MAPRKGAFSKLEARLINPDYAKWTEEERDAADQLSRMGLHAVPKMYIEAPAENEDGWDESGFFPEEDPLVYISPQEERKLGGEEVEVFHRRVAIRKRPSLEARVLAVGCQGEVLKVFDWDESGKWREVHIRLRGGHGSLVQAWVMMKHPELGVLVGVPGAEDTPVKCVCGKIFEESAKFCSSCGAKRPEKPPEVKPETQPRRKFWPNKPEAPRGWALDMEAPAAAAARGAPAVAEGNLQVVDVAEVEQQAALDGPEDLVAGADGCVPVHRQELADAALKVVRYEVVASEAYKFIAVRNAPSSGGKCVATLNHEEQVDTFGWDETGKWRKVYGKIAGGTGRCVAAWVLAEKEFLDEQKRPILRTLLRPLPNAEEVVEG